ncbi:hypothetical protein CFV95_008070 [Leptospira interrogans]|uniref:Uncharacterized protein n=1 Tax=Leptospira interrogans TaxID=173 RepID=A0AAV9G0Y0_LEPIR|nr:MULTISPECIES: hypothetical protein [Leptospira]KAK2618621.1 hypothetical protein CFV95_006125 [Leptospira interrogans]KAK2618958.1 hypothetical protein CFV95_008070 [Leptospira interrogans]
MTTAERITLLRRRILLSKLYKKDGNRRSNIEIIENLLSRCAIQDTFIQDRKLEGEFSEWSNENLIEGINNNET